MPLKRSLIQALYGAIYITGRPLNDGGITILSYHSLDDLATPLSVPPALFREQMALISRLGCATLTMSRVARHLATGEPFPHRAVAITFDDGFANFSSEGLPVLQHHGFKSTLYVITGMVGRSTLWTDNGAPLPTMPLLNRQQIKDAANEGVEVGAHSARHGFLTQLGDRRLDAELGPPRRELEDILGKPVVSFAYPQGDYNRRVIAAVKKAGYTTATTVDQGRARLAGNPLALPRFLVSGNTSPTVMGAFIMPTIGPAYRLINFVMRNLLGKTNWPRRAPGEVDSTQSVAAETI